MSVVIRVIKEMVVVSGTGRFNTNQSKLNCSWRYSGTTYPNWREKLLGGGNVKMLLWQRL
jgi:hypothetical protein